MQMYLNEIEWFENIVYKLYYKSVTAAFISVVYFQEANIGEVVLYITKVLLAGVDIAAALASIYI